MGSMKTFLVAILVVCVVGSVAGIASAQTNLTGAGATFPAPLYLKWFYDFSKQTGMQVNYQSIGSGGGIKAIAAGTVDFGASDAPLSDAQLAEMPAPIVQIPSVGGAIAMATNLKGVGKQLRLTGSTISAIYLGEITRWNDPRLVADNPGAHLPDQAITVLHRSDGSGTTYIYTNYLSAVSSTWKSRVGAAKEVKWPVGEGAKGNEGVSGLLKQIPGAIGYIELADAAQNRIPVAAVKNRAGKFITPSLESANACIKGAARVLKADVRTPIVNSSGVAAYPITGLTFLLVYKHPAKNGAALVKLLNWCMGSYAQKTAASYMYAPLPDSLIAVNKAKIAGIQ